MVVVAVAMVGLDPAIEQGVGRAGVEADDCGRGLLRVDDGEIGNAPQVEDAVAALQARKDMGMEGRHQRGALAAGGDVGAAQVGNDIDAGGFGQARGVKQLQGVALGGHVAYGLAMGAQRAHLPGRDAALLQQLLHAFGVEVCQLLTCARGGSQFIGGRVLQGRELTAQRLRHGHEGAGQGLANPALVIEGDQHAIDAIHAGAGHQAGVYLVRVGEVCLGGGAGENFVLHGAGME